MADDNLPPIPQQRSYPKMLASEKLINFIKDKEKFYAEPYSDYKQWSIGYGSYAGKLTGNPTIKSITKDGADKLLKEEIKKYEANVNKFNTFYNFTQNEFDAMVSFAYNLGSINQLTDNGKRSKEQIIQKMPEYNKAGGKVAGGLVTRRKEEVSIFKGEDTPKSYNDNNVAASSIRDQSEIDTIGNLLSDDQSNRERDGIRPTDGSSDYPILEERAEAVKGAVSEKAV
jgi:GH24 family phage-related lysozyme (muramidase)